MKSESDLQQQVADYLKVQYSDVLFHSDFGSGIKLTKGQAVKQKRMNGGRRAWPDMFIAHAKRNTRLGADCGTVVLVSVYHGLFLELKRENTRLYRKDGSWATPHIAEQADMLEKLRSEGYAAEFAVGFEAAKTLIDTYLGDK